VPPSPRWPFAAAPGPRVPLTLGGGRVRAPVAAGPPLARAVDRFGPPSARAADRFALYPFATVPRNRPDRPARHLSETMWMS